MSVKNEHLSNFNHEMKIKIEKNDDDDDDDKEINDKKFKEVKVANTE